MSDRRDVIEWFLTRCQLITVANGFNTNAGNNAHLGEVPELGPDDGGQAIAIIIGDDVPSAQDFGPETVELQLPIDIQALTIADLDDPHLAIEDLVADIKTTIEADVAQPAPIKDLDRGSTSVLEREEGSTVVGLSVAYTVTMFETWGAP